MRPSIGEIVHYLEILLPEYQIYKVPIVFPDVGRQTNTLLKFKCKIIKQTKKKYLQDLLE
jgi:hypothetical protein